MPAYRNLYNDVFEILESSTSIIKHVEDFNDQYNNQDQYNNVKYPACYVETSSVSWDKNENKYYELSTEPQSGTAEIKIHVVFHTLKQYDKSTKELFFNVVDHVSGLLQKTQSGNNDYGTYSTLLRTKEEYITPSKQLRVAILTFETKLKDTFIEYDNLVTETVAVVLNLDIAN